MERTIKYVLSIIFFTIFAIAYPVFAEEMTMQQLITPTNIEFADCTKTYNIPAENLYYLTFDSISANRFEIKELQSKMGYILFKAANREFLATVAYYSPTRSILKIAPVNSNYYFPPGIVMNIYKYIDINVNGQLKQIEKS